MMQSDKIKRYPGGRPFTKNMANLFFGRKEDLKKLHQLVSLEKLVVLHGRSGLGKSSLINAGLMPKLQEDGNNECIQFRFNAWTEATKKTPLNTTLEALSDVKGDSSIINKIIPSDDSVWRIIKEHQFKKPDSRQILIFDQFEELFSYPKAQVHQFKSQIAELIRKQVPKRYEQILNIGYNRGQDVITVEEEDALYRDLNVRILFIIRSDKMHLLDQLSDYLPTIFKNNHELKALQIGGATDAIVKPATLDGDHFQSQKFTYTPAAQNKIIDFLQDKDTHLIEAIQLQIVCTSFEENVIKKGWNLLDENNIGDLNSIVQNYYHNKIEALDTVDEKLQAARLLEDGLVDNQRKQRLTLHESQIVDLFKVEQNLLDKLINIHLLRRELDQNGGYNYELSHDTLIGPALKAKEVREHREQKEEAEKRKKELAIERRKRRRAVFLSYGAIALAAICALSFFMQFRQSKQLEAQELQLIQEAEERERAANVLEATNTQLKDEQAALLLSQEAEKAALISANSAKADAIKNAGIALKESKAAKEAEEIAKKARMTAENEKKNAIDARNDAETNLQKAINSEKKGKRLSDLSQAKVFLNQGQRVQALKKAKLVYEADPSQEDIRLFIRSLSRSPIPIVFADKSTKPAKLLAHPLSKLIASKSFIYNPTTGVCLDIDYDDLIYSEDANLILGIRFSDLYRSVGHPSYHIARKRNGTKEMFQQAHFSLLDGQTGKLISQFKAHDTFSDASQLGAGFSDDQVGGIITPWNSCFWSISENNKFLLSLESLYNYTDNLAAWQLTDLKGNDIANFNKQKYFENGIDSSHIDIGSHHDDNLFYLSQFTGPLISFGNRKGENSLAVDIEKMNVVQNVVDVVGECRKEEIFMRLQDWLGIPVNTFKMTSNMCDLGLINEVYNESEKLSACDCEDYLDGAYHDILGNTALSQGFQFTPHNDLVLLWNQKDDAAIWDVAELRMADYLAGSYHGFSHGNSHKYVLTKKEDQIVVWDHHAREQKRFEGLKMYMQDLDNYLLLRPDSSAISVRNGIERSIEAIDLENFSAFTDSGYKTREVISTRMTGSGVLEYNDVEEKFYEWDNSILHVDTIEIDTYYAYDVDMTDSIPYSINPMKVKIEIEDKYIYFKDGFSKESNDFFDKLAMRDYVYKHFIIGNNLIVVSENRKVKIFPINKSFDYKAYLDSKLINLN